MIVTFHKLMLCMPIMTISQQIPDSVNDLIQKYLFYPSLKCPVILLDL